LLRVRRSSHRTPAVEIFCGEDPGKVVKAVELTDRLETSDLSNEEIEDTITKIGVLLGYPECCSRAFACEKNILKKVSEWLFISRRLKTPGAIPWETTPFAIIEYIPCSLECGETLMLVRRFLDIARQKRLDPKIREHKNTYTHPFIFFLDRQDQKIELIPLEEPAEEFSYRAGLCLGDDPRLKKIAGGDRLLIEDGDITVLKRGKVEIRFRLKAYLWWVEKAFHTGFWQKWLDAVTGMKESESRRFRKSSYSTGFNSALKIVEKLKKCLEFSDDAPPDFLGFSIASIEPSMKGHVFLTIERGAEKVTLKVENADEADKFFIKTGEFGISYLKETPIDTTGKEEAVKRIASYLTDPGTVT